MLNLVRCKAESLREEMIVSSNVSISIVSRVIRVDAASCAQEWLENCQTWNLLKGQQRLGTESEWPGLQLPVLEGAHAMIDPV